VSSGSAWCRRRTPPDLGPQAPGQAVEGFQETLYKSLEEVFSFPLMIQFQIPDDQAAQCAFLIRPHTDASSPLTTTAKEHFWTYLSTSRLLTKEFNIIVFF
jgi:hypothetical protein